MTQLQIGNIKRLDVADVRRHEAKDFTPWLADNLIELDRELGMVLEIEGTEVPVGNFRLDILARDANSGELVAIENQTGRTDHAHLGQLLTYSTGRNASSVVWIAAEFTDQHKAALDWLNDLNDRAGESRRFFGVEVQAIKIGDSAPAALFRTVASPKTWSKDGMGSHGEVTDTDKKYVRFWRPLLDELRSTHGWNIRSCDFKRPDYYTGAGIGSRMFRRTMRFAAKEGQARVELQICSAETSWNKAAFDLLKEHETEIGQELEGLKWERQNDAKMSRVVAARPGRIDDSEEDLNEIRAWMTERVIGIATTFRPYLADALERLQESGGAEEDLPPATSAESGETAIG